MTGDERSRAKLRASGADRQRAAEILATALREGRLDALEYDNRSRAAQDARSVGDLNQLLADLPSQLGVRDWADHLRVRQADREQAARWLGEALAEGRLTEAEHERRLADLASAGTYADLTRLVDGVPGPPGAAREGLLVSGPDRQAVLDGLAAALADGLISADEHRDRQAAARRAKRYRDLDALSLDLGERANPAERARAVRRLDQAHATGQLDAAEHAKRVRAAQTATRDAELADLLADLTRTSGGREGAGALLSLNRRHRLADAERELAAQELQHALDDGRLTLDEYDERVKKAYAAGTAGDLRPLLRDLLAPADRPPAPSKAPRKTPKNAPRRGRRWPIPLAAAGVVLAVVAGVAVFRASGGDGDGDGGAAREPELGVLWSAPFDRPADMKGQGSWATDRMVIRTRTDRVVAYDLADGHVAWTFPAPADHELCAMSRTADQNVGLVGYGLAEDYECVTVVALDLGTGRPLWQRKRPGTEFGYYHSDEVALAGGVAVLREETAFVALDARAGTRRWRLPVAKGCRPYSVTAGGATAALLTACADRAAHLAVVDVASGRERWRAPLRLTPDDDSDNYYSGQKQTVVLSVDPVVVRTSDEGGAFLAFDAQGKRRATIPQAQPDFDLASGVFPRSFVARLPYPVVVAGDVLVTPARKVGESSDAAVAGFSLTDGRQLWRTDVPWLMSVGATDGTVFVGATVEEYGDTELHVLSTQDGGLRRAVGLEPFEEDVTPHGEGFEVWRVGDRYAFVHAIGTTDPPVIVIGPRP